LLPRDFQFILAEVACSFRSPATLGDRLVVAIWVSQVGRKSFVFQYRLTDEVSGRLVAEGCSTQVWYDYATGESRFVPGEIVKRMEEL
jgi:acyl-CoA thioesterase FadM